MPLDSRDAGCAVPAGRRAHPRLRREVLGYAGYRSGSGASVRHRLLPLAFVTLVIDFGEPDGVVTGARDRMTDRGLTGWGHGVSVGLTPAGVSALLGVPAGELAGATVRLSDVLGRRAAELTARLAEAPSAPARFARLDDLLTGWSTGRHRPPGLVLEAWRRLQQDHRGVGRLAADLGVSRRYLERAFRREVGLTPGAVARTARFQNVIGHLSRGAPLAGTAAACGYTDQPHLTRDTRALAGVTPAELAAFVQYPAAGGGLASRHDA
ncbi:MAG: helix-turn-helix domain-containing protein [Actinoplanes sp.]